MISPGGMKAGRETYFNYAVNAFLGGWLVMLVVGALGHQLHRPVLFIGYWSAVLIELLAEWLFSPGATVGPYYRVIIENQEKMLKELK